MPTSIEEAAAALTIVSFAFQTFAGCIGGFNLFTTARHKGKDAQLLVQLLRLDEYRLIVWAQKTGLLEDSLDPRWNSQIVTESLGELKLLFQETSKLKQRYGLEIKEDPVSSPQSRQADPISDSNISKIFEHEAVIQFLPSTTAGIWSNSLQQHYFTSMLVDGCIKVYGRKM